MAINKLDAVTLVNHALDSVNDALILQIKQDILSNLHAEIDPQLEAIAKEAAGKVFVQFSRYYENVLDYSATLHHVLEIRRQA